MTNRLSNYFEQFLISWVVLNYISENHLKNRIVFFEIIKLNFLKKAPLCAPHHPQNWGDNWIIKKIRSFLILLLNFSESNLLITVLFLKMMRRWWNCFEFCRLKMKLIFIELCSIFECFIHHFNKIFFQTNKKNIMILFLKKVLFMNDFKNYLHLFLSNEHQFDT